MLLRTQISPMDFCRSEFGNGTEGRKLSYEKKGDFAKGLNKK